MTSVNWLEEQLAEHLKLIILNQDYELMEKLFKEAKEKEEEQIKKAIIYALDEDGHTGDWKIKFANDYYNKLKK